MANEFVIKNGYFSQGNSNVTGSLRVSGSIGVVGSGSDVLSVYGSQGNLLVATDTFSGSIFTVTDISGYPILDITSDYYTSSVYLPTLTTSSQQYVVTYNSESGQLFYTASSAFGGGGGGTSGSNATASFASSATWTFTHNLNNRYPIIQTLDSNFNQIVPQNIELTDVNTATITFPLAISGYAIASLGGSNITQINNTASSVFATTGSNTFRGAQTFSGSLIPAGPYADNTSSYDLGSATAAWRDLYVSNGSIKMISGSNSASIQFNNGAVTFTGAAVTLPSSSTVPTASFVTTLNQNVIVTGSMVIGSSSLGPIENSLTLGAKDNGSEGGQLGFNAPGGTYPSASFLDVFQNTFRILKGTNAGSSTSLATIDLTTGNLTLNSGSIIIPSRPAFRVIGTGGSISATTTIAGSAVTVDFNQGSHYNQTTGKFTAPIAGLYQVNVVCRTAANNNAGINQIIVRKQLSGGGATTSQIMLEWAANTSVNHMGGSSVVNLAVGDTLWVDVTAGTISFDGNNNFSAAYIG